VLHSGLLQAPKTGLALGAPYRRNGAPGGSFDLAINVEDRPTKPTCDLFSNGRFSGS